MKKRPIKDSEPITISRLAEGRGRIPKRGRTPMLSRLRGEEKACRAAKRPTIAGRAIEESEAASRARVSGVARLKADVAGEVVSYKIMKLADGRFYYQLRDEKGRVQGKRNFISESLAWSLGWEG